MWMWSSKGETFLPEGHLCSRRSRTGGEVERPVSHRSATNRCIRNHRVPGRSTSYKSTGECLRKLLRVQPLLGTTYLGGGENCKEENNWKIETWGSVRKNWTGGSLRKKMIPWFYSPLFPLPRCRFSVIFSPDIECLDTTFCITPVFKQMQLVDKKLPFLLSHEIETLRTVTYFHLFL